jgi:hypothetical protein
MVEFKVSEVLLNNFQKYINMNKITTSTKCREYMKLLEYIFDLAPIGDENEQQFVPTYNMNSPLMEKMRHRVDGWLNLIRLIYSVQMVVFIS